MSQLTCLHVCAAWVEIHADTGITFKLFAGYSASVNYFNFSKPIGVKLALHNRTYIAAKVTKQEFLATIWGLQEVILGTIILVANNLYLILFS